MGVSQLNGEAGKGVVGVVGTISVVAVGVPGTSIGMLDGSTLDVFLARTKGILNIRGLVGVGGASWLLDSGGEATLIPRGECGCGLLPRM